MWYIIEGFKKADTSADANADVDAPNIKSSVLQSNRKVQKTYFAILIWLSKITEKKK